MRKVVSMLLILVILLAAAMPFSVNAANVYTQGEFSYTVTDGKATIVGYSGNTAVLTLPSMMGGYPLTTIGDWAFYTCTSLEKITIPMSITTIGDWAFDGCSALKAAFYTGKKSDWAKVTVGKYNEPLTQNLSYADEIKAGFFGDVNEDGYYGANDALEVLKGVVGKVVLTDKQLAAADVDGNGKPESSDALAILKKVVGKLTQFPIESIGNQSISLSTTWTDNYTNTDATGQIYTKALNILKQKGIETRINNLGYGSAIDTIVNEVMAGKSSADIYEVSQVMCRDITKKKVSVNIYDSKTLNKSLFQCGATESVTFNGKAYGITWASKSVTPLGVIYNKNLIAKYAKDYDIVKLYNDKKWNFDNFQAIAKACTIDTDGNGKSDIYGFTSNSNIIGMALTSNAGGSALKVNERVEATMCSEAGIQALEWCKELLETDQSWLYKADINRCVSEFVGGKAAMFVSYLQFYPQITAQSDFEIGFVPMPIGPAQSDYKDGVYDAKYYIVPNTKADRLDAIGVWMNTMAGVTNEELLKDYLTNMANSGFDEHSQNAVKWVVNNSTPAFSSGVFSYSTSVQADQSVTSSSKVPATVMAAIKTQAQQECDDYYADIYDYSK